MASPAVTTEEKDIPKVPNTIITESAGKSYFDTLGAAYQEKIKNVAQSTKHILTLTYEDGRTEKQEYTRMKVLQWQFDEIEEMRAKIQEYTATPTGQPLEAHKISKAMYKKAATYYLFNTKTQKPMTEDEYNHCYSAEIRPVIDAAILITLLSDPN